MSLRSLLNKPLANKTILRVMAIASLIGVTDTIYLTASKFFGSEVQCVLVKGCDTVLGSKYAYFSGVPLAVWGLGFYASAFVLINLVDIYGERKFLLPLKLVTIGGFASSLVFLYLQIFVLRALCLYCLVSLASSTLLFLFGIMLKREAVVRY